jgi:hypothetical protein
LKKRYVYDIIMYITARMFMTLLCIYQQIAFFCSAVLLGHM